jgi:hypothetical protein
MSRRLIWANEKNYHGPACSNCRWIHPSYEPTDPAKTSMEDARKGYRAKVAAEFSKHDCKNYPKNP